MKPFWFWCNNSSKATSYIYLKLIYSQVPLEEVKLLIDVSVCQTEKTKPGTIKQP